MTSLPELQHELSKQVFNSFCVPELFFCCPFTHSVRIWQKLQRCNPVFIVEILNIMQGFLQKFSLSSHITFPDLKYSREENMGFSRDNKKNGNERMNHDDASLYF